MKKVSLLVLVCMILSLMLTTLTACSGDHTHKAGTEYVADATNHYNLCSCGEKMNSAAHADGNADDVCDTCGITMKHAAHVYNIAYNATHHYQKCDKCADAKDYVEHVDANNDDACDVCGIFMKHTTHSFGTDWKFNATQHYNVCADCGAEANHADHADANNDGLCDTCAATVAHTHTYASAWTSDETGHWNVPTCGHTVDVANKAAHTAPDEFGNCTVCGYHVSDPVITTVEQALEIAALTQNKVQSGWVDKLEYGYYHTYYWYECAENYLHYFEPGDNAHTYAHLGEDGEVFYFRVKPGEPPSMEADADESWMGGPRFMDYELLGESGTYYGVLNFLNYMYITYSQDANANFAEVDTGLEYTYSFAFTGANGNVAVVFSLDPVTFILNNAYVTSEDEETTLTFTQATEINPQYALEDIAPTTYKMVDAEGNAIDFENGIVLNKGGNGYTIYLKDVSPISEYISSVIKVSATKADGSMTFYLNASFNKDTMTIDVKKCNVVGDYIVSISIGTDSYVLPVKCIMPPPETIEASVDGTKTTEANIYTGVNATIDSVVASGFDAKFTAELIGDNAANATLTLEANGKYTFVSATAGTYTVKITSAVAADVTCELTITVAEAPKLDFSTIVIGEYEAKEDEYVKLTFNPTDATSGTMEIDNGYGSMNTWSYTVTGGVFAATVVSGSDIKSVEITADGKLMVWLVGYPAAYEMVQTSTGAPVIDYDSILKGEYEAKEDEYVKLTFNPTDATSGTMEIDNGYGSMNTWSYTVTGGVFAATVVSGSDIKSIEITADGKLMVWLVGYPAAYEMVQSEGSGEGPVVAEPVVGGASIEESTNLNNETKTYTTEVAAGETVYFYLSSDAGVYYYITATIEGDAGIYTYGLMGQGETSLTNGALFEPNMTYFDMWIRNDTAATVTVTFTLTFEDVSADFT